VLLAIQRNRCGITQWDLAEELGIDQISVSRAENGQDCGLSDAHVDALFDRLELDGNTAHANFVKWWRDNSTL
jgi:DNA-binding XRE family transcriptional regulator